MKPLILALALASPVTAAQAGDPRLVTRIYDANEVVRIDGQVNVQASIRFGEEEHIENVAIGDANAWQVTPNKRANMLFVKPLSARARTNMTVVTSDRTYLFDLVSGASARPLYVLRFTYPEAARPAPAGTATSAQLTRDEQALTDEMASAPPRDPASLNFAWEASSKGRGKSHLHPTRVYDDGEATYLAWSPGTPVPAILMRNASGEEGPVNFSVRQDVIVIDGVPGAIVLRLGKNRLVLERKAPATPPAPALASAPAVAAGPQGE